MAPKKQSAKKKTATKAGPRLRQTQLSFSNASSASPAAAGTASTPPRASSNIEVVIITPSKKTGVKPGEVSRSKGKERALMSSAVQQPSVQKPDSDSEADTPQTGKKTAAKKRAGPMDSSGDSEMDEDVVTPASRRRKRDNPITNKKAANSTRKAAVRKNTGEDSEMDEDPVTPVPRRRKPARVPDSDEDDEVPLITSPPRTKKPKPKAKPRVVRVSSDEDDEPVVTSARKRRKVVLLSESDASDLEILPPGKELPGKSPKTLEKRGDSTDDLQEDAELASKTKVLDSRTRFAGRGVRKTQFQKNMERLKAKREGREYISSEDEEPKAALYDSDDAESLADVDDDAGEGEMGAAAGTDAGSEGDDEEEEESWIVQDDEGPLGGPDGPEHAIPLAFTRASHMSDKDSFKNFCQWLVQSLLNPHYPLNDELAQAAMRRLESWTNTYGVSVIQSSIWKIPFVRAMKARPTFHYEMVSPPVQGCVACNGSTRTSRYSVFFSGSPYDPHTLEDLDEDEIDTTEDELGKYVPDEDERFMCGKSCFMKANLSHQFLHWKKQLRTQVEGVLVSMGYLDENSDLMEEWEENAEAMDPTERTKWANDVFDEMETPVFQLYQGFKRALENAQSEMNKGKRGAWKD